MRVGLIAIGSNGQKASKMPYSKVVVNLVKQQSQNLKITDVVTGDLIKRCVPGERLVPAEIGPIAFGRLPAEALANPGPQNAHQRAGTDQLKATGHG